MENINILVQGGTHRIIQHEDGTISPQSFEQGSWQYEYYQDGYPVIRPDTASGIEECENWAGLQVSS